MPFKPVGIDDDGKLPTRARAGIADDIADPASAIGSALTASIAADNSIHTGMPNFRAGFVSKPDYSPTNTIIVKPSTDTDPGIIEWAHDSPSGYLFHLVTRPNMHADAALIAFGIDENGTGLLVANKKLGRGIILHQHSTITSGTAYGLQGAQDSTLAPVLYLEQRVEGAAPLLSINSKGTLGASQRSTEWKNDAQTLGYVEAAGKFVWQHSVYFKQNVTSTPGLQIEGNSGATSNIFEVVMPAGGGTPFAVNSNGLLATTRGSRATNADRLTENPLRVTNLSTTANVDTVRIVQAAGQVADQLSIRASDGTTVQSRFDKDGYFATRKSAAPADADVATGELFFWFDTTAGAAKLMVKAKDSGGTVRTAAVALA